MPTKNTIRYYDAPAYYHVYNRGFSSQPIFIDDEDRSKFLSIFARHLDPDSNDKDSSGRAYSKYDIEIVAYCLMDNHFHLLVYQDTDPSALTQLMRSTGTAYTMYFNNKYKRSGHLFQGIFKATRITDESYLLHITRYIHMNPRSYLQYKWSSISAYFGKKSPKWLHPERCNNMSPVKYRQFLEAYRGKSSEKKLLKDQVVD